MNKCRMQAIMKPAAALLLFATFTILTSAAETIPKGDGQQVVDLGGISLYVFTYRPKHCTPSALLIVFHGLHRNVDSYRDDLEPIANELCLLELVPLFDEQRFPSWRYQKGGIAHQGTLISPAQWTGNLVLRLVNWARKQESQPNLPYVLVGHSAGAQFLSRFAAFIPNDARAIVIANPSTHVVPSLDIDPPFGFKRVYAPDHELQALQDYLAQPVILVLGKDDVGDKDRDDEPAAVQQGKTRYQRGMNTFHAAQAVAAAHAWTLQWKLIELPGVSHSAGEVFGSKQVKQALRDALAAPGASSASQSARSKP